MRRTLILDVDDCLYTIDCGYHAALKDRICVEANKIPSIRARSLEWTGEDRDFTPGDLGDVFPKIVIAAKEAEKGARDTSLNEYLDAVYTQYELIEPNPELAPILWRLIAEGVNVQLYTNGPSSRNTNRDDHVQKTILALTGDRDLVEYLRPRCHDLLQSVEDGYGKPDVKSARLFLDRLGVHPLQERVMFFDDSPKNLATMASLGVTPVWTWTSAAEPPSPAIELADKIGATRTCTIIEALERARFFLKPRASQKALRPTG